MDTYSVPEEAAKVLFEGIINNPLHANSPSEVKEAAKHIKYLGSSEPTLPINWRFAESIAAIKGFQGSMLNVLLKKKYGLSYQQIVINTDHAQLFIASPLLLVLDPLGAKIRFGANTEEFYKYYPDGDKYHAMDGSPFKMAATNIYKTKDGRFYHLHASMNSAPTEKALDLDASAATGLSYGEACQVYQEKALQYTAAEIENLMNDEYRQAGTTCWSIEEYRASEHGKANAHVGLYEVHHIPNPKQTPSWWKPVEGKTSPSRPLFGLKIVDLTRIIASPTITRELAELGASVMRITSPNVTDHTSLCADMGWGKWNAYLDLTQPQHRERLKELILDADIVVDGYRPGVMAKWGFGKDDILKMFENSPKGIIYVHENCYGWNGPWSHRSGWQQISDANCGISLEFGRAMGNDEPVTPILPNSDFCTGAAGAVGVLEALITKAEKGGSYVIDVALNYYSQWLANSCSTYPEDVWKRVWSDKQNKIVFRHTDNMMVTIPRMLQPLVAEQSIIFSDEYFEVRQNGAIGVPVYTVKPILGFPQGTVKLGYNVGSRGNGVDAPRWPENLLEEIVAQT
ncbi:hypothetical protein D9619_010993 [Psilocybe cf. subviscida]|uniref:CoA-transferase family III n=1 Tax=Psilocybe cf. subviscida TaxID=2480587 RepID=A0A8H5B889_9AGAR|nr:hypothetical protein D9619_010993 [Psilocybe cf. subviscida]